MTINLVLASDQPIVLDGLEGRFRQEPDINVVARCASAEETLQVVREHRPDVVILGLQIPEKGGLDLVRQMNDEKLPTRVILLTTTLDEDTLLEAIRLGVPGILLKEMAPHLFVQCVRKVHAGEQWLERRSFRRALERLLQREAGAREVVGILTPREIEIVRMVISALRNKEIAEKLFISEGTVKGHLHHIYEKLRLNGREELIRYARARGLTPSRPEGDPAS